MCNLGYKLGKWVFISIVVVREVFLATGSRNLSRSKETREMFSWRSGVV